MFRMKLISKILAIILFLQFLRCNSVYNGERVKRGETMMSMAHFASRTSGSSVLCGGVLITWKHVLTAAHCRISALTDTVFIGSRKLHEVEKGIVIPIQKVEYSPRYDKIWEYNDLAIVTLEKAHRTEMLRLGIRPVEIKWDASVLSEDTRLDVMGFGCTKPTTESTLASTLRIGPSYIADIEQCAEKYAISKDPRESVCLDGRDASACSGDSGGPVVYRDASSGEFVLVGIVSGGEPTNRKCTVGEKWHAVNVERHRKWITRTTGRYCRWK